MRKVIVLVLICFLFINLKAQENTWRDIPYFLKGYETQYAKSPKEAALEWFKDARFGLFIHWGPATLYGKGEWVMYNDKIPVKEYETKTREFTGEKFNAKDYIQLALDANMKYITFVAKHHDGYALWDSKASDYNSMSGTPQRDFVKELAVECRKAGLGLFIYYSVGLDWHHPYFLPSTLYNPARPHYVVEQDEYKYGKEADFKHYLNFAKTQIMEICTQYGPIAGLWFDTVGGIYEQSNLFNIQEVYDMIHAIQPHALICYKTGANGNEDFITGERHMGSLSPVFKSAGLPQKVQDAADRSWESNKYKAAELNIPIQALGWSYHASSRQRQKSTAEVMELLELCGKMNANLLLNIGPKPDGTILEENIKVLQEVGGILRTKGFPILNKDDYMEYRENKVGEEKEKENRTAR